MCMCAKACCVVVCAPYICLAWLHLLQVQEDPNAYVPYGVEVCARERVCV